MQPADSTEPRAQGRWIHVQLGSDTLEWEMRSL